MGDVIPFKKRTPAQKHSQKILCQRGFHKWEICQEKQFDVKQGRLVAVYRCLRCGARKTQAQ